MKRFKSSWRAHSNEIIVGIIKDNPDVDEKELRKLIRDAYPFGLREMHPYKIWCSEVKNCLFELKGIGKPKKKRPDDELQGTLFN